MPFSYREWIFGGKTFCCCLPVRFGVISMSVIGILVGGILSIGLWFELSTLTGLNSTAGERAAIAIAGLVETFLFLTSVLGFTGAIVRKQSFIQTYAYMLYVHFFLNIAVAGYLFFVITNFQANAIKFACDQTVVDPGAQDDCRGLFRFTTIVYTVVAAIVLLAELYGTIIVTRCVNLVKREKRMLKESRKANDDAFSLRPLNRGFYGSSSDSQIYTPLNLQYEEFDPYRDAHTPSRAVVNSQDDDDDDNELMRPPPPIEVGYGGGSWTHREITDEEKSHMERAERGSITVSVADLTDAQREQRLSEIKSPFGPPSPPQAPESDDLPRYASMPEPGHVLRPYPT